MRYNELGRTGVTVSEIGFGAWAIALDWWGKKVEEDEAVRMLRRAHDLGITLFETADMYGRGKSERLIGRAFEGRMDEVVVSTKFGYDFAGAEQIGHAELPQRFDEEFARAALRASLERLGARKVGIYGLHNPKMPHVRDDGIFRTLDGIVGDGLADTYQAALGPAIGWAREGLEAMERPGLGAVQTVYNVLEQTPGRELLERAAERGVGVLARVPDASGILTGRVGADTKIDEKDHRSVRKGEWIRASLEKVEQLRPIAERNGLGIAELAVKFITGSRGISSALPTLTSVEEVEQYAAMSGCTDVPAGDMAEIRRIYDGWPAYELKGEAA
ncbi:MAG: aldo/keto reductase [Nitrosopumilus sp.]|nr:aldo/keto reductase [Nitrosopumilus sp.]